VRLIGFAPNAAEKDRLTAVAAATPGVERVDNLVVVAVSPPTL
jgi:osmotically-inducible protein OsmY